MKKLYVLMAIILVGTMGVSCTAESVAEEIPTHYADADTGGQNGNLPTPPPLPKSNP